MTHRIEKMEFGFDTVDIYCVDVSDTTFKITIESSVDILMESIRTIGLISPPVLKRLVDGRFLIVSGFRRIAACRAAGWTRVNARIIKADAGDRDVLRFAIADNAFHRPLNVIEQALAVSKLADLFPQDDVALSEEANAVGVNVNPGLIRKLKKIHTVGPKLKTAIAAGIIPLTIGLELSDLDDAACTLFLEIIDALNPTLNQQKEILRLTIEIARSENAPLATIIKDLMLFDIINDPELDRNRKIQTIRQRLKQVRYPVIHRFEKKYVACLQRMKLPESIVLQPPADFEGDYFSMNLRFRNLSGFKEILNILHTLQDHPDFAEILEKEFEDN